MSTSLPSDQDSHHQQCPVSIQSTDQVTQGHLGNKEKKELAAKEK